MVSWGVWTMNGFVWLRTVCRRLVQVRTTRRTKWCGRPPPARNLTDRAKVAQLTTEDGRASGHKKDELDARLSLAKVQLELDQDEVDETSVCL